MSLLVFGFDNVHCPMILSRAVLFERHHTPDTGNKFVAITFQATF